jgi:hypothetical protein
MILLISFKRRIDQKRKLCTLWIKFDEQRKEKEWFSKFFLNFKKKRTKFKKFLESLWSSNTLDSNRERTNYTHNHKEYAKNQTPTNSWLLFTKNCQKSLKK